MRAKELAKMLRQRRLSHALLLTTSQNRQDMGIRYLSGVAVYDFSCLLLDRMGRMTVWVKGLELENARQQKHAGNVKPTKLIGDTLKPLLGRSKTIGVNLSQLTIKDLRGLRKTTEAKFVDIGPELDRLRETKTSKEIQCLRKACAAGDAIFRNLMDNWKRFRTEADAAVFIITETYRRGLVPSFDPIVASGKHASLPHYFPKKTRLLKGFCVVDFGVKYRGYCSDMTRTIYLGKPSAKETELYDTVLSAQKLGVRMSTTGTLAKDIDFAVRKAMGKEAKRFIHGLGHQLGLDIHENTKRAINRKGNFELQKGMIITIEPGSYHKNRYGIRIEDTLIVGKKPMVLTKTTKRLILR